MFSSGHLFTVHSRGWLVELNAALSAMLFVAGIGKQLAPRHLAQALQDVLPFTGRFGRLSQGVRLVAAVEVVAAVCVLMTPARVAATIATAALGVGFIVFGAAGWLRHSRVSCGCFATSDGHPLGPANVMAGLGVIAISAANWVWAPGSSLAHHYTAWSLLAATTNVVAWTLWAHRRTVRMLLFGYLLAPDGRIEEAVT